MLEKRRLSRLLLLAFVSSSVAFGCSSGNSGPADGGAADGDGGGDALPPSDAGLETRIDQAVNSIQSDTCFAQDDTSQCQWADYQLELYRLSYQ